MSSTPPKKLYVLDTNVLLYDPRSMFSFSKVEVGIPIMVLEELEQFKRESSGRGKNARETVRYLDDMRERGSLSEGVHLDNEGVLRILFTPTAFPTHPALKLDVVDNQILLTAFAYKQQGYDVKFISKDLNARVKADVLGLESEDYLKGYVPEDTFYKGWISVQVPAIQLRQEIPDALKDLLRNELHPLIRNEYVLVESQHNAFNFRLFRYTGSSHKPYKEVLIPQLLWPIEAKNPQQLMALDALLDPAIEFVSLLGPAGTGKTFLSLLAGLHMVMVNGGYQKMLISRPVIPLGPDIGYLPGDLKEKLHTWMQPIYDNVEVIIHSASVAQHLHSLRQEEIDAEVYQPEVISNGRKKRKGKKHSPAKKQALTVDELMNMGKLSLEAITYMRGRSIPYQYILIDEVQNLSPHEVKTLISRVGQGSKIVLCGDPYQIDSPYLDFSSNGLVIATDRFKGEDIFSTIFLETSERSQLSKLAGELL